MSSIFVVVYPDVQYNINAPGVLYYRQRPSELSGPLPTQPETNTHFLGRYTAPNFARFRYTSEDAVSATLPAQPSTEPHFVGRYTATIFKILIDWRQNPAQDFVQSANLPDTNTHFIGRYAAPQFNAYRYGLTPADAPLTVQPETNTHFIARYSATVFAVIRALRENAATDFVVGPGPAETNTHFIGRFQEARIRRLEGLWRNPAGDIGAVPPPGPVPILEVHQKMHTHPPAGPGTPIYRNV